MQATIWKYGGVASWYFITLTKKQGSEIKDRYSNLKKGWGSIPVEVTIGKTTWKTSIFPDKQSGSYLLPLKALVRSKEGLREGKKLRFALQVKV